MVNQSRGNQPQHLVIVDNDGNPFKPSPERSAAHDAWSDDYVDHMLSAHPWVFGASSGPNPEQGKKCTECELLAEREPPVFGDELTEVLASDVLP